MDEVRAPNVSHNVSSAEFLSEQASSKKLIFVKVLTLVQGCWKRNPLASGNRRRTLSLLLKDHKTSRKKPFQRWKESGGSFLLALHMHENIFRQPSQKMVTKLVRHFDQDERQTDAAVHWDSIRPVLWKTLADKGAQEFSEQERIQHVRQGSEATCLFRVRFITVAIGNMFKTPFIG